MEVNILYKTIQVEDKSFENLVVLKILALDILVNSQNLQGHAATNKMYSLLKGDFF